MVVDSYQNLEFIMVFFYLQSITFCAFKYDCHRIWTCYVNKCFYFSSDSNSQVRLNHDTSSN